MAGDQPHRIPLWGLFGALIALTAAEVGLFESWSRFETVHDAIPKYALVILILVFTLPKAAIVLIYFMHLRFERQIVVGLAIAPFLFAAIAVLGTLVDAVALKDDSYNKVEVIGKYEAPHHGEDHGEGHGSHGDDSHGRDDQPAADPVDSGDPYGY